MTNVVGTKNIIRMQEKKFRMIFFSSAEVYGDYEGVMTEDVMEKNPIRDTYQMNDYAITKWAGELMCMNSTKMYGRETVRVRPVNCYGPGEHYTPYRGFIPKFIYRALFNKPYTVFKGHKRIIDYVEDSCRTWVNKYDGDSAEMSEDEFLRSAVEDMVRRWEIRELNTKMDEFTEQVAEKHPESVSEAVLKAREEEDGILYSKYTQRKKFDDGIKQSKTKLKL